MSPGARTLASTPPAKVYMKGADPVAYAAAYVYALVPAFAREAVALLADVGWSSHQIKLELVFTTFL